MSEEKFQDAMKKRLAKLSSMPVEMTGVEKAVKAHITRSDSTTNEGVFDHKGAVVTHQLGTNVQGTEANSGGQKVLDLGPITPRIVPPLYPNARGLHPTFTANALRFWRPFAAVAAGLVLVAIVGMALLTGRPAQASEMVQLHRDIVSGKVHTMPVDSVQEVNDAFAAFGKNGVKIEAPQMAVMSCCMQQVGSRQVYCVLMKEEGVPVTLTIADAGAVEGAKSPAVMHKGAEFHVEVSGELTMVTTERGGRRVCLIGALPAERLMGLAEGLKL